MRFIYCKNRAKIVKFHDIRYLAKIMTLKIFEKRAISHILCAKSHASGICQ
jgi:hypothetical protein